MFSLVVIPIGLTLGAAAWALARGKGGLKGFLGHVALAVAGSVVGGFGAAAMLGMSHAVLGLGALVGGLLFMAIEAIAFRRPRRVAPESTSPSG